MVVNVLDHVQRCFTNQDGEVIRGIILDAFSNDEKITISFKDIDGVNSSFINSALIELLDKYEFDFIKNNLVFVNTTKQINEMIRSRFSFEVNKKKSIIN